jgi:hypothetical protein
LQRIQARHPKARRAIATALGTFHDSAASEALRKLARVMKSQKKLLLEKRSVWGGLDGQILSDEMADLLNLPPGTTGYLIKNVAKGSPADDAGMRGGTIFATIGGGSFPEWRGALVTQGLPIGLLDIPELPGIVDEERIVADHDTLGFLRRMKAIGGLTPREGYAPLPAGALRRAVRAADETHGGRITWHIVYGRLAASQSRPSISPA